MIVQTLKSGKLSGLSKSSTCYIVSYQQQMSLSVTLQRASLVLNNKLFNFKLSKFMQKSILLNLADGGTVSVGTDHFVLADRPEGQNYTTVVYETFSDEEARFDVIESPEQIHRQLNSLKD